MCQNVSICVKNINVICYAPLCYDMLDLASAAARCSTLSGALV